MDYEKDLQTPEDCIEAVRELGRALGRECALSGNWGIVKYLRKVFWPLDDLNSAYISEVERYYHEFANNGGR